MPFLPPSCRFPPLREGNRAEVRFPLPAGFPHGVRGTQNAVFAPLLQVPPASRGEPRRGSVSPACRFPLLREGNQKGSVPPACRGNLKEGVRNFAYFEHPPPNPLTNAPKCGIIGVIQGEIPSDPLTNAPKMGYKE
jgi:hypothetical protein